MLTLTGSLKINRTQYLRSNKILFKCFVQSKTFNFSFKYSSFWSFFNIVLNFVNIKANQKEVYNNPPDLPDYYQQPVFFKFTPNSDSDENSDQNSDVPRLKLHAATRRDSY